MNKRSPFGYQWWSLGFSLIGCVVLTDPLQRHANTREMVFSTVGVAAIKFSTCPQLLPGSDNQPAFGKPLGLFSSASYLRRLTPWLGFFSSLQRHSQPGSPPAILAK